MNWLFTGLFAAAISIPFTSQANIAPSAKVASGKTPLVRVLVEREEGIKVEGFDVHITDIASGKLLVHMDRRASIPIKCSIGAGMQALILPAHGRTPATQKFTGPIKVESQGGFLTVDDKQFRDALYVYSFNGSCMVVNHVDLEKYVAGLLNSEMNASWNSDTLMAQAVAARTYALHQMSEAGTTKYRGFRPPFDLDSSVKDQVYEGAHKERYKALRAVERTRGIVLTHQNRPIKAFYHSTCGGHTETAERVWGGSFPYIKSVECGWCNRSPRYNWNHEITEAEFAKRLAAKGIMKGKLVSVHVAKRNLIGRAAEIEVRGSEKSARIKSAQLREILGPSNLMSTDFTVAIANGKILFVGHGSGHGVGMCQWGAKTMGENGKSYKEILTHYYPAAKLTKIY